VAVVFFVAFAGHFHLPGEGDGAGFAAELLGGGATGDIEAVGEFAFHPVVERRVRADLDFADDGVRVEVWRFVRCSAADAEIDKPPAEVGAIHPLDDLRVVAVRD
jgi:hypothetical protein